MSALSKYVFGNFSAYEIQKKSNFQSSDFLASQRKNLPSVDFTFQLPRLAPAPPLSTRPSRSLLPLCHCQPDSFAFERKTKPSPAHPDSGPGPVQRGSVSISVSEPARHHLFSMSSLRRGLCILFPLGGYNCVCFRSKLWVLLPCDCGMWIWHICHNGGGTLLITLSTPPLRYVQSWPRAVSAFAWQPRKNFTNCYVKRWKHANSELLLLIFIILLWMWQANFRKYK